MHLNCHAAYPRIAVNYFRKKLHHRCGLQNTGIIILIQSIICNYLLKLHHPFDIEYFHEQKKTFCKALFLIFS